MKVLVTGAAGFIGGTTIEYLLEEGHQVVALDDLSSGQVGNIPQGVEFIHGKCGDEALAPRYRGVEACIHFAARIEAGESMIRPEEHFENNSGETFRLLRILVGMGVDRFVYSSSCAVYGTAKAVLKESDPTVPESPYGQSKLIVEQGLRWLTQQGRIRGASLRYFNAAGGIPSHPERHNPETHLIPLALAVANGDRPKLSIFGSDYDTPDGTCIRDYIHVSDLARAHIAALVALDVNQHLTVNLGTGIGHSNREVVQMVRDVTRKTFSVDFVERRAGDPASLIADNTLALQIMNWSPYESSVQQIVEDAWRGYQELRA